MKTAAVIIVLLVGLASAPARAQGPTTELDVTAGYSTEGVAALANQLRVFGETPSGLRYYLEGAGNVEGGPESDAFSGAYPYRSGLFALETYVEQPLHLGKYVSGVRLGRFRTPFGIYGRSDHAYSGFLRAPLIRYGQQFALSNFWIEAGGDVYFGTPHLQLEVSAGTPSDADEQRHAGPDRTIRLQGYTGPWILGASYLSSKPAGDRQFYTGRSEFYGIDGRWMRGGLQIRGEWIYGTPFFTSHTEGWYVDALLHRPWMGSTTAVARYEAITYDRPPFSFNRYRVTVGAKVQISRSLVGQINFIHQSDLRPSTDNALDVGLTYTIRR